MALVDCNSELRWCGWLCLSNASHNSVVGPVAPPGPVFWPHAPRSPSFRPHAPRSPSFRPNATLGQRIRPHRCRIPNWATHSDAKPDWGAPSLAGPDNNTRGTPLVLVAQVTLRTSRQWGTQVLEVAPTNRNQNSDREAFAKWHLDDGGIRGVCRATTFDRWSSEFRRAAPPTTWSANDGPR